MVTEQLKVKVILDDANQKISETTGMCGVRVMLGYVYGSLREKVSHKEILDLLEFLERCYNEVSH